MVPSAVVRLSSSLALRVGAVLVLVLAFVRLVAGLETAGTPGWDEAGHCFAALRLGVALRTFELGAFWTEFLRSDYYTPLGRLGMGLGFLFSDAFAAPRIATLAAWFLTIGLAGLVARRVARDAGVDADAAMFWTVLGGTCCYLGTDYSRAAYQEPWSALATVSSVLAYLRAREGGTRRWALLCGLLLGAGVLVKYTYALYVIGAVGLSGLWDIFAPRLGRSRPAFTVPEGARPVRLALWCAVGLGAVLVWWFVLPFPGSREIGRAHWWSFIEYLRKAKDLPSTGPWTVLLYWPFKAAGSPVVFALHLAGIAWGFARWRSAGARLCALLAFVSALGYVVYPFRIDRFLLPNLFGAWVLAAVLVVHLQGRFAPRLRPVLGAALVGLVALTPTLGIRAFLRLIPDVKDEAAEVVVRQARTWSNPFRDRLAPAVGPVGMEAVLDVPGAQFHPAASFGWIGGTGTELPRTLIGWRMFQEHGDVRTLYLDWRPGDDLWSGPEDPGEFRLWVRRFIQVGVLDPPDPKDRARPFEQKLVEWMAINPDFQEYSREEVELEVRPGETREFTVTLYLRTWKE